MTELRKCMIVSVVVLVAGAASALAAPAASGQSPSTASLTALAGTVYGAPPAAPLAAVALVDRSCDEGQPALNAGLQAEMLLVARVASTNGLMATAPIRWSAAQRTSFDRWTHRFVSTKTTGFYRGRDIDRQVPAYVDQVRGLFRANGGDRCREGSDLIGAFMAAQRFLSAVPASVYGAGEILFVSNGLVYGTDGLDFRHGIGLSDIPRTIARLRAAGRIPQLPGITVYLMLDLGVDPTISASVAQRTQAFWFAFLRAAGARARLLVIPSQS